MAATASEVRAFARENGIEVGSRGRFSADLVEAFNRGKRAHQRYVEGTPETRPVEVATTDKRGRKRTKVVQVNGQAAREWAVQNGHEVKVRGRLSETVVQAYAQTLV